MNALANVPCGPGEHLPNDRIYAKARYLVRLVQGSQVLEAAAVDSTGYEQLVEVAVQMLRSGEAWKAGE